jgi:excisionase family DNA binding protein
MTAATPFLTVRDLATEMQLAPKTVMKMLERGEIPGKKIGNKWRVSPVEWERTKASFSATAPRSASQPTPFRMRKSSAA